MKPTQKQFSLTGISLNKGHSYQCWLALYAARNPGVQFMPSATVILDAENTVQPDSLLRCLPVVPLLGCDTAIILDALIEHEPLNRK
jgi:hypothetical protein